MPGSTDSGVNTDLQWLQYVGAPNIHASQPCINLHFESHWNLGEIQTEQQPAWIKFGEKQIYLQC